MIKIVYGRIANFPKCNIDKAVEKIKEDFPNIEIEEIEKSSDFVKFVDLINGWEHLPFLSFNDNDNRYVDNGGNSFETMYEAIKEDLESL